MSEKPGLSLEIRIGFAHKFSKNDLKKLKTKKALRDSLPLQGDPQKLFSTEDAIQINLTWKKIGKTASLLQHGVHLKTRPESCQDFIIGNYSTVTDFAKLRG